MHPARWNPSGDYGLPGLSRLLARLEAQEPALAVEARRIVAANPARAHVIAEAAAVAGPGAGLPEPTQSLGLPGPEVSSVHLAEPEVSSVHLPGPGVAPGVHLPGPGVAPGVHLPGPGVAPVAAAREPVTPASADERARVPGPTGVEAIGPPAPIGPTRTAQADQLALFVEAAPAAAA
jgi:hypothetical protein